VAENSIVFTVNMLFRRVLLGMNDDDAPLTNSQQYLCGGIKI